MLWRFLERIICVKYLLVHQAVKVGTFRSCGTGDSASKLIFVGGLGVSRSTYMSETSTNSYETGELTGDYLLLVPCFHNPSLFQRSLLAENK